MGINNKNLRVAIGLILIIEIVFLLRLYIIYSFYKNDEIYGDGIKNIEKYDNDFYETVLFSILITISLSMVSIFFFRKKRK